MGVEVLGSAEPLADAETLQMLWSFLQRLEVPGLALVLNSVGDATCRPRYREALTAWLTPRLPRLCEDCNRRYVENPLRVFDCKVEADRALLEEAPRVLDVLCQACRDHFGSVQDLLGGYGIPFQVDPRMVRGLDYYQRTVFEVTASGLGAQNAVLGGGRYDGLVEELGGPAVPGFGFALGIERLLLLLPDDAPGGATVDLAVVALGPEGFAAAVPLTRTLREQGLAVVMPLASRPLSAQMKRAERQGARFALFVGKDEVAAGRFGLKDLSTGEQHGATLPEVVATVTGRIHVG
jgi:histidyl-tRNA synthetase